MSDSSDGHSLWGTFNVKKNVQLFARVDEAKPSKDLAPALENRYYNLGVIFTPVSRVDLAVVYKQDKVDGGSLKTSNGTIGAATGAPFLGTCAGMIVLSREIAGGDAPVLPLLDVTVARNAFGRQLDSFEAELPVPVLGDEPVHAVFIRAPIVERVGPGVAVLAEHGGRPVVIEQGNLVAAAFHPELVGEARLHAYVLGKV